MPAVNSRWVCVTEEVKNLAPPILGTQKGIKKKRKRGKKKKRRLWRIAFPIFSPLMGSLLVLVLPLRVALLAALQRLSPLHLLLSLGEPTTPRRSLLRERKRA